MKGGGRGYYRNISLLSAWAHAPFMHNNAIGPEICGRPSDPKLDFYTSPYVDADGKPLANPPACWPFDPSVEGRYRLYKASMEMLLYPERRPRKMALLDEDMIVDVAPKTRLGSLETGLSLRVPKGFPAGVLSNLRFKDLLQDAVLARRDPGKLDRKYEGLLTPEQVAELKGALAQMAKRLLDQPGHAVLDLASEEGEALRRYYLNVLDWTENQGHRFGEQLSEREKAALIAFLATLRGGERCRRRPASSSPSRRPSWRRPARRRIARTYPSPRRSTRRSRIPTIRPRCSASTSPRSSSAFRSPLRTAPS
jgi:hypothetical protein